MKYLLLLALLVACASAKKEAIKLTEKGHHEEALLKWVEAFKNDPKDEEVIEGLRVCQETVLNDRLVKVRDLRLARDEENALKKLKSVVEFQKSYNIKLDFNSSSFQGKETQSLWPYQKMKITEFIAQKKPIAAELRQVTYEDVFQSMEESKTLAVKTKELGSGQCRILLKSSKGFAFYRSFAGQFCQHYDPQHSKVSAPIAAELYKNSEFKTEIKNVNSEMAALLENKLEKKFAESPWFHTDANRQAKTTILGEFDVSKQLSDVELTHSYDEKVPYTEYSTVKRNRSVPYTKYVGTNAVTDYRTESYEEQVAKTKYRNVTRLYKYPAKKFVQEFALQTKGSVKFAEADAPLAFSMRDTETWFNHNEDIPQIGLSPARGTGTSALNKFGAWSEMYSLTYLGDLNLAWKNKFCKAPANRTQLSMGEAAVKCHRLNEYPKDFVDPWFKDNFSVTSEEAEQIIGNF